MAWGRECGPRVSGRSKKKTTKFLSRQLLEGKPPVGMGTNRQTDERKRGLNLPGRKTMSTPGRITGDLVKNVYPSASDKF